jgi:hypothetical protein
MTKIMAAEVAGGGCYLGQLSTLGGLLLLIRVNIKPLLILDF